MNVCAIEVGLVYILIKVCVSVCPAGMWWWAFPWQAERSEVEELPTTAVPYKDVH